MIGTKVSDKKLLQLSSNQKHFSVPELEQNLRSILGNLNPDSAFKSTSSVYRQVEERCELIDEYVAKKRKVVNPTDDELGKIHSLEHPKLVGKCIYHKWVKGNTEEWIYGNVLKVIGDVKDENCEFEVKYEDEEETLLVKLYEDFKNGDLTII